MLKLLQISIFLGVIFANIYWQLTPNGLLASLIGLTFAGLVTLALWGIPEFFRALKLEIKTWGRKKGLG